MIELKNVSISYRGNRVLDHINLTIKTGEFFVIIGSSGCGKTTLIKTINKLNIVETGDVLINGTSVNHIKIEQLPRLVGYVVQEGGLFPHMTVEENIALALQAEGKDKFAIDCRITELLDMVNLNSDTYRNMFPSQLSGGQKQRVGVARAFAADPEIILMDEPFSALDPMTRLALQEEVYQLQKRFRKTIVFVTHDMSEAIKLADRICIIQDGHVVQCDTPELILRHPSSELIKSFIGKNRLWDNPAFIHVEDVMCPNLLAVPRDCTVMQATQTMLQKDSEWLIVTEDDGGFSGLIKLEDLKDLPSSEPVENHLSSVDFFLHTWDSLSIILEKIGEKNLGIVPVLNNQNIVAGYISQNSLLSTLSYRLIKDMEEEST